MNWLKHIYYYLFCSHELRKHIKVYSCYRDTFALSEIIECQKCGEVVSIKTVGKYYVENGGYRQKLLKNLKANGFINIKELY